MGTASKCGLFLFLWRVCVFGACMYALLYSCLRFVPRKAVITRNIHIGRDIKITRSGCPSASKVTRFVNYTDEFYVQHAKDCGKFKRNRGYLSEPATKEELDFPIAYSIVMYKHVDRAERLLRAIYQPQNFYCIHIDGKADETLMQAMNSIVGCFDNVFIPDRRLRVAWGSYGVLEVELICMEALWKYKWKYFINLTGQEFPLKTNWELVQILQTYKGANDIFGTSHIANKVDHERMRDCLVKETKTLLGLSQIQNVSSVFFGGGTPSLADPATIESVLAAVTSTVKLTQGAEVTMEVNPTPQAAQKLREFQLAGVNRISLGIQSLDDKDLVTLGREHSATDSLKCLSAARTLFPGRVSVDVMFGLPAQTLDKFKQQLDQLLPLCDDHISLYQLTLERGTKLFKQVLDRELAIASPELMAELYECAVQILEEHDLKRYEASNFARNGATSEHNLSYWRSRQYIGVGPGAHGRFFVGDAREARIQTLEPEPWMREVEQRGHATRKNTVQTQEEIMEEVLMLGLRTTEGISHQRWDRFSSHDLHSIFSEARIVRLMKDDGYLILDDNGLRCTDMGLNVVDSIVPELLNVMGKHAEIAEQL